MPRTLNLPPRTIGQRGCGPLPPVGWVWSAVFSPDGQQVLTASWDWTASVWCAISGECLRASASWQRSMPLAQRTRKARAAGKFCAAELVALYAPPLFSTIGPAAKDFVASQAGKSTVAVSKSAALCGDSSTGHGAGNGDHIIAARRARKTPAHYLREWREFKSLHGSSPVESPRSAGYMLAHRLRMARSRGKFSAAELAELADVQGRRGKRPRAEQGVLRARFRMPCKDTSDEFPREWQRIVASAPVIAELEAPPLISYVHP